MSRCVVVVGGLRDGGNAKKALRDYGDRDGNGNGDGDDEALLPVDETELTAVTVETLGDTSSKTTGLGTSSNDEKERDDEDDAELGLLSPVAASSAEDARATLEASAGSARVASRGQSRPRELGPGRCGRGRLEQAHGHRHGGVRVPRRDRHRVRRDIPRVCQDVAIVGWAGPFGAKHRRDPRLRRFHAGIVPAAGVSL